MLAAVGIVSGILLGLLALALCIGVVIVIINALLKVTEMAEQTESSNARREKRYSFSFDQIVITSDEGGGADETVFRMNYHGLKGFAAALRDVFVPAGIPPYMGDLTWRGVRTTEPMDSGWHTHTDLLFPPLPEELLIGTGDELVLVADGWRLYASPEAWVRLADEWLRIADRWQAKRIVLDRDQTGRCHLDSTGRVVIEYVPDLMRGDDDEA